MTLADYISKFRADHGLSQRKFAEQCGLSNGYISMLEKGLNPNTNKPIVPSLLQLQKLADGMNTPLMQLLEEVEDIPVDLSLIPADDLPPGCLPMPKFVKKPRLGTIACGVPILAVEDATEFDDVPDDVSCDFTLLCKGDSMINARIFDGDVVYIRKQEMVDNGEIAAVLINDQATLKRVHIYPDHILLSPENPMYQPLVYWGEEMNTIRILGKAVAFKSLVR